MNYIYSFTSNMYSFLVSVDQFIFGNNLFAGFNVRSGIINIGNTCFLNSILQSLLSIQSFQRWINLEENRIGPLQNILRQNFDHISSAFTIPCDTSLLCRRMIQKGWSRNFFEQQDAHEFFQFLIGALQNERVQAQQQESIMSNLQLLSTKHYTYPKGVRFSRSVGYIALPLKSSPPPFQGSISTEITCSKCKTRKPSRYQSILSVSLELPDYNRGHFKLQELIIKYLQTSRVDMVECKQCTLNAGILTKTSCSYKTCMGKIPQTLCIHIQRTQFHQFGFLYKSHINVDFPMTLDLSAIHTQTNNNKSHSSVFFAKCSLNGGLIKNTIFSRLPSSTASFKTNISPNASLSTSDEYSVTGTTRATYSLCSVIEHVGDDPSVGHYVSFCRISSHNWLYCSDEQIHRTTPQQVLSSQAYMLFYERGDLT